MTHPSWAGLGYVAPERQPWYMPIQPGVVLRKMQELGTQNDRIQRVVDAQTGAIADALGTPWIADWASYYGEWRRFWDEHQGWLDRFTSGAVETLVNLINRSNIFDRQLRSAHFATGTVTREERQAQQAASEPASIMPGWGWALIVIGGIGVGAYALYSIARIMREGRLIARPGTAGLGGRQRWAVYEIVKVPSHEYANEEELDLVRVTRPTVNRETAMRQMRKLRRTTGSQGAKYAVHGAGKGLDGLGGPTRVRDLDGSRSTYNLEIER